MSVEEPNRPPQVSELFARVRRRIDAMAEELASDPDGEFQKLPSEIRERELPAVARREYLLTLRVLRDGGALTETDLASTRAIVAQRASEGTPLALVLHNWHRGHQIMWREFLRATLPGEEDALNYINDVLLEIQDQRATAVVEAYQAELDAIASEEAGARHLVARRLLSGQDARLDAARFGIEVASSYGVLSVEFGRAEDEIDGNAPGAAIASRRKLRKILRSLGKSTVNSLPVIDSGGGSILLPAKAGEPVESVLHAARNLVARVRDQVGIGVIAGFVQPVDLGELPRSEQLAVEIRGLARAMFNEDGVYLLSDVALAHQLTRPGAAGEHLVGLLSPLDGQVELLDTLDCYFRNDLDRGRTARAMRVHPNTINNRLNRITMILGRDLNRSAALLEIGSALTILRTRKAVSAERRD